jgi:predicted Zn-dependent protease
MATKRLWLLFPLLLSACAASLDERTGNSLLSSNNDPVIIPEAQEIALGAQSAQQALTQYKPLLNAGVQAYEAGVGARAAGASDRPGLKYTFTVLEAPEVNAFACPGGFVFITTGILKRLKDEAELAAVLGHEVGHVVRQHSLKRMQRAMVAQMGLGTLQGLIGGGTAALLKEAGPIATDLLLLRNGREAELEADEQGLLISSRLGLDPAGMVGVQEMLMAQGGGGQGPFAELFASHPPSEARIAQAKALLPKYQGAGGRGAEAYRDKVLKKL